MDLRKQRVLTDFELKKLVQILGYAKITKITQDKKCTITSIEDKYGVITYHFVQNDILEFILTSTGSEGIPTVFAIDIKIPSMITAETETNVDVTLKPSTVGQEGFEKVIVKFNTVLPNSTAIVTYKATDSIGKEYTFENEGSWGPETGFDIPKDYEATTPWKVTFSEPGKYTTSFQLVRVADNSILVSSEVTVDVK